MKSKSEKFMAAREAPPMITPNMWRSVSDFRKESLEQEVHHGLFREPGSYTPSSHLTKTAAGTVSYLSKKAQLFSGDSSGSSSGGSWRGSGGTIRQTPEVYSPLWLNSNLNLPRDRATINAWCRSFFALNPIVQNAISLHSTYPLSKLNIKCKDEKIRDFFEQMIEEIDLMNVCVQIAQEYWTLGEAFVYAELDERNAKWSRLLIQNPDYMVVKRSVVSGEPIVSLRPDENLKRICTSNSPWAIQQREQLDQSIIEHVKRGENIPLSNFYVSHLARRISPYEARGTSLIVSVFKQLMLFDRLRECKFAQADNLINPITLVKIGGGVDNYKPTPADIEAYREIFECYDEETEVLTDQGFKKFDEVIEYAELMDGTFNYPVCYSEPKAGVKIACFNPETEQLEYHEPLKSSIYNYEGDMYHFHNEKIDIKVTPNHDMWVSEKQYEYNGHRSLRKSTWSEWKKIKAKDLKLTDYNKFRSKVNWIGVEKELVDVCGKQIPVELYLEFLGYLISEGCLYTNGKSQYTVGISQTYLKYQKDMSDCINKISSYLGKSVITSVREADSYKNTQKYWSGSISGREIFEHFKSEVSDNEGNVKAQFKQVPSWIKQLSPRLLNIFLEALVKGDGSVYKNPKTGKRFEYYTTSKQLADDVYEIVYKCGLVPTVFVRDSDEYINGRKLPLYTVLWSTTDKGKFPQIYKHSRNSQTKEKHSTFDIVKYNGKVWCFTVPTGLFVTRRNGKITIQGNSAQYDKDFKIFTHDGVSIERVGAGQGIYDTSNDITQIIKELYIGLMAPNVIMDGGGDVTYANGGVALDVLRQRYTQFREVISKWLRRRIFAPISKMNEFYEYKDGKRVLIVPDVEWNHMSLFDMGDYISNLINLAQSTQPGSAKISLQSVYKSLGLEYEDELRKIKTETIDMVIQQKELETLQQMSLNDLRALGPDDEVPETTHSPLPGENPNVQGTPGGAGGGLPGMPPMGPEGGLGIPSPPMEMPGAAPTSEAPPLG